jgi:hypothetical protein
MPTTGNTSSRTLSDWRAIRLSTSSISTGPATMAVTSVTSIVRRSRKMSTISLAATAATRAPADSTRGIIVRRRALRPDPSRRTKASSSTGLAGLGDELGSGAARDHPPVGQNDDRVAERGDFLHDVGAEQQALAARPQIAQQRAQRADAHDVEAVRGLVEQDRLRIVDERAGDRDLHALPLREPLRAPVGNGRDAECLHELVDPRLQRAGEDSLQRAVVANVFRAP